MRNGLLRKALIANAVFSTATGCALLVGAVPLGQWLLVPAWQASALGIGLIGFAVVVGFVARNPRSDWTRAIIATDIGWVAVAAVLLIAFPDALSTSGSWALILVSLVVADIAVIQYLGLRRKELHQVQAAPAHS